MEETLRHFDIEDRLYAEPTSGLREVLTFAHEDELPDADRELFDRVRRGYSTRGRPELVEAGMLKGETLPERSLWPKAPKGSEVLPESVGEGAQVTPSEDRRFGRRSRGSF